ncbi:MAG: hypothetical protein HY898_23415 [Deltaproteobacteria bacterium]|nr:hypothetical protein [Deltaproteobacteria bacterium]
MMRSWWLSVAGVSAILSVVGVAHGQDSAASQALFNAGLADMETHRYDRACPALAESYHLEARAGTLFTLAECEVAWGKIASAAAHYDDYLQQVARMPTAQRSSHAEREAIATKQQAAIAAEIPLLTLTLAARAPRGLIVRRDGAELGAPSLGVPIPVDPGEHLIVVEVPGARPRETRVQVARGERKRIELTWNPPIPAPAPVVRTETPIVVRPVSRSPWIYVSAGVGAAGVAAGTITGLMSASRKRTVDDNCIAGTCNAEGKSAADSGRSFATASTVCFSVGLAGFAAATVLLLVAPTTQNQPATARVKPVVAGGPQDVVLGVRGAF